MKITPDRRLFTKYIMVHVTITVFTVLGLWGLMAIVAANNDPAETAEVGMLLWSLLGGLLALMWIISVPVSLAWIRNLSYVIEDDKIVIYKGILTKIQQSIPFRMITDFRLHRSLYDRFLGIGSIDVQTAGQNANASGYEGRMTGLLNWGDLHEELRSRLESYNRSGASVPGEPATAAQVAGAGDATLRDVLQELRAIRTALERRED